MNISKTKCTLLNYLIFTVVFSPVYYQKPECKPYDVYFDPNVPEVIQCRPLLERMRTRVEELLCEWEDHPTLRELITVIDRITAFTVTSPLMKYITGLEVLVQKAQVMCEIVECLICGKKLL